MLYGTDEISDPPTLKSPNSPQANELATADAMKEIADSFRETPKPNGSTREMTTEELLSHVYANLKRYFVLTETQMVVLSLWSLHTYVFTAARHTPYLRIFSPTKQCGKSNLIDFLAFHVAHPWRTDGCTAAALVRKVDKDQPTLLLDETDAAFGREAEYTNHLRGVINSGYSKNGRYTVCVGQGANMGTHDFRTFCPKVFSGIGKLPDTIMDRAIPLAMRRKKPSEMVADFAEEAVEQHAESFKTGAKEWATEERRQELRIAIGDVKRLDRLNDRQRDVSRILLAIADIAGGGWPKRVRQSLTELFAGAQEEAATGEQLLQHLRALYGNAAPEVEVSSAEICQRLCEDETWPWATWRDGSPINRHTLASLLKPFEIFPEPVRPGGQKQVRGYRVAAFMDAWERYTPRPLPCTPEARVSQPSHTRATIDD